MDPWFDVKKEDVITVLERAKDRFPWGDRPDESYHCLIFWDDGSIWMTVDDFFEFDSKTFSCCRFYTTPLCNTLDEFNALDEDTIARKAYNAWCSGAR